MKIKIITCSRAYNLGAVLQTYALQKYLLSLNFDTEVIDYNPDYFRKNVSYTYVGSFKDRNKLLQLGYILYKLPQRFIDHYIFKSFLRKFIRKTNEYRSFTELCKANLKADIFICGSDQIWCPTKPTGKDETMYLRFVKNAKKISYAASFGETSMEKDFLDSLKNHLDDFSFISVRENSGVDMLKLIGIDAVQVLDPVFLLSSHHWEIFSRISNRYKKYNNYVLVYPMSVTDIAFIVDFAQEIARKTNNSVVVIGKNKPKQDYYQVNNATPQDFVSLIKHASYIVTNSFHATAFSIIFNKEFFICGKEAIPNTRINSLLELTHLSERYINVEKHKLTYEKIKYELVNPILKDALSSSKFFLNSVTNL